MQRREWMSALAALLMACGVGELEPEAGVTGDGVVAEDLGTGEGELRKSPLQARVLFWSDNFHNEPASVEALASMIPTLHAHGYRQLYIELSDSHLPELEAALAAQPLLPEHIVWQPSEELQQAWAGLLSTVRAVSQGSPAQAWRVVPIDFDERGNLGGQLRDIFQEQPGTVRFCGVGFDALAPEQQEGVLGTIMARALKDTLSIHRLRDVWSVDRKTVIFYGLGHGLLSPLPIRHQHRPVAFMGHELRQRYGARFASLMSFPQGDWAAESLRPALPAGRCGFIPARRVRGPQVRQFLEMMWNASPESPDATQFPSPACRDRAIPPEVSFEELYDWAWVPCGPTDGE
jgi:hypothetical protein